MFYHIAVIINSFRGKNNIIYGVWGCVLRGVVAGLSRYNCDSLQDCKIWISCWQVDQTSISSREICLGKLSWANLHCPFSFWPRSYFVWASTWATIMFTLTIRRRREQMNRAKSTICHSQHKIYLPEEQSKLHSLSASLPWYQLHRKLPSIGLHFISVQRQRTY